jgi:hypothetical protein
MDRFNVEALSPHDGSGCAAGRGWTAAYVAYRLVNMLTPPTEALFVSLLT